MASRARLALLCACWVLLCFLQASSASALSIHALSSSNLRLQADAQATARVHSTVSAGATTMMSASISAAATITTRAEMQAASLATSTSTSQAKNLAFATYIEQGIWMTVGIVLLCVFVLQLNAEDYQRRKVTKASIKYRFHRLVSSMHCYVCYLSHSACLCVSSLSLPCTLRGWTFDHRVGGMHRVSSAVCSKWRNLWIPSPCTAYTTGRCLYGCPQTASPSC